ncbi:MAG: hypothetical protein HY707_11885 [Ignavibacteriae bacterium]|nr:hypothetical protein [Ignavibacteriota bacterium]
MKSLWKVSSLIIIGLIIVSGCSKEDSVGPQTQQTDEQALKQQVTMIDSVAEYSASDEQTIDDGGIQDPEYEPLAKAGVDYGTLDNLAADSLYPVKWGRRIFWDQIVRNYDVTIIGDTIAHVLITKTVTGEFWVGLGMRSGDSVFVDSIIQKPFTETVKRKVRFYRIARTENPLRNWVPVALTMVQGYTNAENTFSIDSVEISAYSGEINATITNPLETWFRLGRFFGSVPVFFVHDSVRLKVYVSSSSDSAELVYLRHGIMSGRLDRRRGRMELVSTSGGSGNYQRVYERTFVVGLPLGVSVARFNAVVDVISYGSVYDNAEPFLNEFWGAPYIAVRR